MRLRNRLTFAALSYVPFTGPWRTYRDAAVWVRDAQARLEATVPGYPSFDGPLSRDPQAVDAVIDLLCGMLEAVDAIGRGAPACVVEEFLVAGEPNSQRP